jgi:hypothetical protein
MIMPYSSYEQCEVIIGGGSPRARIIEGGLKDIMRSATLQERGRVLIAGSL